MLPENSQQADAIKARYQPAIDELAERIASKLKFNLEIEILKRLGLIFYLKNLPYFLLASSLILGAIGTLTNITISQSPQKTARVEALKKSIQTKPTAKKLTPRQRYLAAMEIANQQE